MDAAKVERFYRTGWTVTESGCWEWNGGKDDRGYGHHQLGRVHRVMYQLHHGVTLTRDRFVCHHCDNPPCMNPAHLFMGSATDNMRDASRKRRLRTGNFSPFMKITDRNVRRLRADYAAGGVSYADLAARYGVSRGLVGQIVRGEHRILPTSPGAKIMDRMARPFDPDAIVLEPRRAPWDRRRKSA